MNICIFGSASNIIDESYIKETEELGYELGKRGHSLVFGAGSEGLMGASARGMKKVGAEITGVVPEFFFDDKIESLFTECTKLIKTESMRERKHIMEDLADDFIITPGGVGTFEEMFEIVTLKQLGRINKPIAIYNINHYYDNLQEMMEHSMREGFVREKCHDLYRYFDDMDKLINFVETDKGTKWTVAELKR